MIPLLCAEIAASDLPPSRAFDPHYLLLVRLASQESRNVEVIHVFRRIAAG